MGMTATQKILSAHSDGHKLRAGKLISANVDIILGNDITSPVAINELRRVGAGVSCPEKVVFVLDHFVPCKDIKSAEQCKLVREFAKEWHIDKLYDAGRMGVEHALLPEIGLITPSALVIGADSHTCTYGALGCFSTGIGSTDMAAAMATGKTWFRVPSAIRINLLGKLNKYVTGKDVALHIIGLLGVNGATYKSLEFFGDISSLSVEERLTIANMAIECGAKNAFFPLDDEAEKFLKASFVKGNRNLDVDFEKLRVIPDDDAEYERTISIDLSAVSPTVAFPHLPDNVRRFGKDEIGTIRIDQVVIGSCTNGRISDMRQAAEIMRGKQVCEGVRCIVIPATPTVFKQCLDEGLTAIFTDCGAVVSTPTCGPCLGGYMGILADGERAVATTNRNFVGRMGAVGSEIYLASPYVAAQSAISGYLDCPQ